MDIQCKSVNIGLCFTIRSVGSFLCVIAVRWQFSERKTAQSIMFYDIWIVTGTGVQQMHFLLLMTCQLDIPESQWWCSQWNLNSVFLASYILCNFTFLHFRSACFYWTPRTNCSIFNLFRHFVFLENFHMFRWTAPLSWQWHLYYRFSKIYHNKSVDVSLYILKNKLDPLDLHFLIFWKKLSQNNLSIDLHSQRRMIIPLNYQMTLWTSERG